MSIKLIILPKIIKIIKKIENDFFKILIANTIT